MTQADHNTTALLCQRPLGGGDSNPAAAGPPRSDPRHQLRIRRHRNRRFCRPKRTAVQPLQDLPLGPKYPVYAPPPRGAQPSPSTPSTSTGGGGQGTPPSTSGMLLGSIHMKSYQSLVNASLSGQGSTSSTGRVSATDPYIDPVTPTRVTAYTGVTAILSCFVNNLGQRSVSIRLRVGRGV